MQAKLLIGAVAIVALGVFAVAFLMQPAAPAAVSTNTQQGSAPATTTAPATQPSSPPSSTGSGSQTQSSGYTLATVAEHNSASSCWAAINGNVYDLTTWINQHPGGPERILSICGTDGSAAFNAQHGGQRQPAQELSRFLLGPLAQ